MPMQPRNSFRAVARFMAEGIELTLRIAAPAHVLNHDVITLAREPNRMRIDDRRRDVAAVGLPHQQRRLSAGLRRIIMIRNQVNAIRHAAAHAALKPYAVAAIDPIGCFRMRESHAR
jgi:hypothetical protein